MISGIFEGIQFVVDSSSFTYVPFKKKLGLRKHITDNGGIISYILTKKSNFVLTADGEKTLSSYKGSMAMKYGVPVVHMDFVADCVLAGIFLDPTPHVVGTSVQDKDFSSGKISAGRKINQLSDKKQGSKIIKTDLNNLSIWVYKDPNGPQFPEKDYKIAKDMILKKTNANGEDPQFFAIEFHVIPSAVPCESPRYRIFTHHGSLKLLKRNDKDDQIFKECYYSYTVEEAMGIYVALHDKIISPPYNFERAWSHLSYKIGSDKMKEQCIEAQETSDGTPPILEVTSLVDYLWKEAVGCLSETLAVPVGSLKLQTVQEAEAVLVSMKECLDRSNHGGQEIRKLWKEFCQLIPHEDDEVVFEKSLIAEKQNLCQLIRDIVTVSESTNMSKVSSQIAKYRALRCHIEHLDEGEEEFERIKKSVVSSLTERSRDFRVLNIFSLDRPVEESNFTHHLDNKKLLYHASRVSNFVGILSRGLLLPKIVVDDFGGKRSDPGMLGSGIYFGSSASTSAKYSARGSMGSRFMLINEVALGKTKRYRYFDKGLTAAPEGYHSTHGVAESSQETSDFKDDEFVIYNPNQQRMKYLVEFSLDGEYVRKRHVDFAVLSNLDPDHELMELTQPDEDIDLSDVTSIVDPLTKVEAGLKGSGDQPVPLQAVRIKAKLLDLVAQVVVLQSYKNNSTVPIEAKFVFPLDDMAAVCGFEAFINGKHIVGEVKEKEQAHKEYREAISQGHGAYLMDEETPDVFTVSVGNLPPNASVVIKITYVAELAVEGENISFSLPGSVAPWKRSQALDDVIQTDVDTVRIEDETRDTTIQVAIEMPFDIRSIQSPTHPIRIKRTATKAVVELEPGHMMGDGFQLVIGLAEIHVPRMWMESHDTKHDSEAGMLVFYPEFEVEEPDEVEVLFCIDASCSMKGSNLKEAKKILQMCIHFLPDNWLFNIVVFGSYHSELFTNSQQKTSRTVALASDFIKSIAAHKGGTELWRALESLSLIPSMSTADHPRNVFVISDGHVTEESTTLELIRHERLNTRVFTLGVGATSNRHMLRALAQIGAGASEVFNSKTKSKWERKVKAQLSKAGQPGLTSVSVTWQQHDSNAKPPIQAPHEIVSLFSGSRLVVYGLVSNCTQAFLTAEVNGREISTMVSTCDLSKTRGKILHQLVARGLIKDWEEGNLDKDHTKHEVVKRDTKDYIISISKEFSIVSQFTSFIAVEKREKDEKFFDENILELVDEDFDIIPYISWEEDRSPRMEQKKAVQTTDDEVLHLLAEAKNIENVSVLQAEDLYKKACDLAAEKRQDCSRLVSARAFLELSTFYSTICHDDQKKSAVIDLLIILASEDEDEAGFEEVIQQLTDVFGMETLRGILEVSSEPSFHPKRNLILEIFPESEYGWSSSAVDNYESSTTESTESSSSESDSSSEEETDEGRRVEMCLRSKRREIEVEENEEETYEDDGIDWSDDLYDEGESYEDKQPETLSTRSENIHTSSIDALFEDLFKEKSDTGGESENRDSSQDRIGSLGFKALRRRQNLGFRSPATPEAEAEPYMEILYDIPPEESDTNGDSEDRDRSEDGIRSPGFEPLRRCQRMARAHSYAAPEAEAEPYMDDIFYSPPEKSDTGGESDGEDGSEIHSPVFEALPLCQGMEARSPAAPEGSHVFMKMGPANLQEELIGEIKAVPREKKSKSLKSFSSRASSTAVQEQEGVLELSPSFESQIESYEDMEIDDHFCYGGSSGGIFTEDKKKEETADVADVVSDGIELESSKEERIIGFGFAIEPEGRKAKEIFDKVPDEGQSGLFGSTSGGLQFSKEATGAEIFGGGDFSLGIQEGRVTRSVHEEPDTSKSTGFGSAFGSLRSPKEVRGGQIFGGGGFGLGIQEGSVTRRVHEEPDTSKSTGFGSTFGSLRSPKEVRGGQIFGGGGFGLGIQEGSVTRSVHEEPDTSKSTVFESALGGLRLRKVVRGGQIFGGGGFISRSALKCKRAAPIPLPIPPSPPPPPESMSAASAPLPPPIPLRRGGAPPPPQGMSATPAPPPPPIPLGMAGAPPPPQDMSAAPARPPPPISLGIKGAPPPQGMSAATARPPSLIPLVMAGAPPPPQGMSAATARPPSPIPLVMSGAPPPPQGMRVAPAPPPLPPAPPRHSVLADAPPIPLSQALPGAPPLPKPRSVHIQSVHLRSKSARSTSLDKPVQLKSALGQPTIAGKLQTRNVRLTTGFEDVVRVVSPPSSPPYSFTSPNIPEREGGKLLQKEELEKEAISRFYRKSSQVLRSEAQHKDIRFKGLMKKCMKRSSHEISFKQQLLPPMTPKIEEFFKLQNPEGYWSMDDAVFSSVGLDTNKCIAILKDAGAMSLGVEVFDEIARFFATVLMLFLLRSHFPSVFSFSLDPLRKTETGVTQKWKEQVSKAFCWLKAVDKKLPSLCWRLELGNDWELAANSLNSAAQLLRHG